MSAANPNNPLPPFNPNIALPTVGWGETAHPSNPFQCPIPRRRRITRALCLHDLSLPIVAPFHVGVHCIHPNTLREPQRSNPTPPTVIVRILPSLLGFIAFTPTYARSIPHLHQHRHADLVSA